MEERKSIMKKLVVCFNTASGKYYCNIIDGGKKAKSFYEVSIPQAVSTIAISKNFESIDSAYLSFNTASGKYYCNFAAKSWAMLLSTALSFNTASGKYYCNWKASPAEQQAAGFNTASGKYYCNQVLSSMLLKRCIYGFNTASGKYYCN